MFTAQRSYATVVFGVVILSVCLSVTRMLYDKTKQCTADIGRYIPQKRNHSVTLTPTVVGRRRPFPPKSALRVTHPLQETPTSTDFHL